MVMQIAIKVDTGYNCDWRNIEALQPEGFKGQTANEKETLKNSIVKNGFHDAFDVWQHEGKVAIHRRRTPQNCLIRTCGGGLRNTRTTALYLHNRRKRNRSGKDYFEP
jgi:hypothetical protein